MYRSFKCPLDYLLLKGTFCLAPRNSHPIPIHDALRILLPDAPASLFLPLDNSLPIATQLIARLTFATIALRKYRRLPHNIVQLYLGLYIDSHIPLFHALEANPAINLANVNADDLQPNSIIPWSQFSLPDHVTSTDVVAHIPTDPIPRLIEE